MEERILRIGEDGKIKLPDETIKHLNVHREDTVTFEILEDGAVKLEKDRTHVMIPQHIANWVKEQYPDKKDRRRN